jgi:pimeloyl-ACP methyl ester carboxylesterase
VVVAVAAAALVLAAPPQLREPCLEPPERAAAISFRSQDGVRLAAVVLGGGDTGIVLAHGSSSDLCEWIDYGRRLAREGYRVLLLDFRNSGSSGRSALGGSERFGLDLVAAARELRRRGARRVV